MESEELKSKIQRAIGMLLRNDLFLLEIGVHERSVAHKLAEYLQQEFPEYHVDCEYNKDKNLSKRLEGKHGCRENQNNNNQNNNDDLIYPDIIIHRRNTNDNLLVIEIKKSGNNEGRECDYKKLELLTDLQGKFKYKFGLFLEIGRMGGLKNRDDGKKISEIMKAIKWYPE